MAGRKLILLIRRSGKIGDTSAVPTSLGEDPMEEEGIEVTDS